MGHANLKNISTFFARRLYAKGKLTIQECSNALVKAGETVHASEGNYDDQCMLQYALETVVDSLLQKQPPVIVPVSLNEQQETVFQQFVNDEIDEWDEKEYQLFDSIIWKYNSGWRKKYPNIPCLQYHTN